MSKPVIILGCGPAGLLAAHACRQYGREFAIFSRKIKSSIGGAQYLHVQIPGIYSNAEDMVTIKVGDRNEYARKVYGDGHAPVSWDHYPDGMSEIFNMRKIYDDLWDDLQDQITDMPVTPGWIERMNHYPLVSTIPLNAICDNQGHTFESQKVYIDYREVDPGGDGNLVLYNGRTEEPWYRMSRLFGWESWEYSESTPKANATVVKPLRTDCNCLAGADVLAVGRYGAWDKNQLIHNAYFETMKMLEAN